MSPSPERERDPIPLSALQHAVYCLRQAALIHLEGLWSENRFTAEGQVLHLSSNLPSNRRRRDVRRVTHLPLFSRTLNLSGYADAVDFLRQPDGTERPFPVEYKRGKPKPHHADEVQLCAQALCLEEMTGQPVPEGALFYGETRRQVQVACDAALRQVTCETITVLQALLDSQTTPPPTPHKARCRGCSLQEHCRPQAILRPVRQWQDQQINRILSDSFEGELP